MLRDPSSQHRYTYIDVTDAVIEQSNAYVVGRTNTTIERSAESQIWTRVEFVCSRDDVRHACFVRHGKRMYVSC